MLGNIHSDCPGGRGGQLTGTSKQNTFSRIRQKIKAQASQSPKVQEMQSSQSLLMQSPTQRTVHLLNWLLPPLYIGGGFQSSQLPQRPYWQPIVQNRDLKDLQQQFNITGLEFISSLVNVYLQLSMSKPFSTYSMKGCSCVVGSD